MQLIRQGIQLSYNALELIRKIAMLRLHLFMPVFMVLVRMSQGLDVFWRPMNHEIKGPIFLSRRKRAA